MELLIGSYDLKLDSKMRVSLPQQFRLALKVQPTNEVLLTVGADGCVVLGDVDHYGTDYLDKLGRLDWTRAEDRALLRDMAPRTFRVRIDSECRVTLPPALVQWAGLKAGDTVRAQGMSRYIEMWEVRRLETLAARGTSFEDRLERRLGQVEPPRPSESNG
ncbi:MAG TPA: hypothetical protein VMS93_10125 [Candidatus Saccharimonadales bacterium]|nr:hypothetical protein [Candidatus Saccharimonadales bacterium]